MAEKKIVEPRLAVQGLRHSYGDTPILKGVDLSINRGEILAIMGRSGCGKSTLLRCMSLLESPTDGIAELDGQQYMRSGKALFSLSEIRSQVVMVFQEYNLFPNMTALRNITLALEKTRGRSKKDAEQLAHDAASQLGLDQVLHRYPQELSGGQAQRLALARAIVLQPMVLLLDEITAALDPETLLDVVEAIRHIRKVETDGNMAIVIVTHLMRFAAEFADRVAFLDDGRIVEHLPARDFFENCRLPETQAFVSKFLSPL